jgi:uncharacterized DUF497 family protein
MEFDWDDGNRDKSLFRHGVHDWEIEEAIEDPKVLVIRKADVRREPREVLLGRSATSGKYLRVIVTYRIRAGRRQVRPISAVEMTRREKRQYLNRR